MKKSESLINEFLQYQNINSTLDKQRTQKELTGYDHSELNCIQCIGTMEAPNVTAIAQQMRMTRGGISKIVQKLLEKGAIVSYRQPDNRQKVYYTLTDLGRVLFEEHEIRHRKWRQAEMDFYDSVDDDTLEIVTAFMKNLNHHLFELMKKGE